MKYNKHEQNSPINNFYELSQTDVLEPTNN